MKHYSGILLIAIFIISLSPFSGAEPVEGAAVLSSGQPVEGPAASSGKEASDPRDLSDRAALEQLEFANGLLARGAYRMAITEYADFLDSFPGRPEAPYAKFATAEAYFFMEEYPEALKRYRERVKADPSSEHADSSKLRICEALFLTERYDDVLAEALPLTKASRDLTVTAGAYYYAAKAYQVKGDLPAAVKFFSRVVDGIGENYYVPYALLSLGDAAVEEREFDKAAGLYKRAVESEGSDIGIVVADKIAKAQFAAGRYDESAASFLSLIESSESGDRKSDSILYYVYSLYNNGDYEAAIDARNRYSDDVPDDTTGFEIRFLAAQADYKLERYDAFLKEVDELLSSGWVEAGDADRALLKKAEVLIALKRYGDSLAIVEKEMADPGGYADKRLYLKGESLYGLGRFDESANALKEALKQYPNSKLYDDILYSLSYAFLESGKKEESRAGFREFFQRSLDSPRSPQAVYRTILLDIELKDTDNAVKDCRTFLSAYAYHTLRPDVLLKLGGLYSDSGMSDKALSTYKSYLESVDDDPRAERALFLLGYNLQLLGRHDEALNYYWKIKESDELNGPYCAALKNCAQIYAQNGDEDRAAETYSLFISKFADNDLSAKSYLWTSKFFLDKGKYSDALRVLVAADGKAPSGEESQQLAYFKGESYRNMGEFDNAIAAYGTLLNAGGESGKYSGAAHIGMGLSYAAKGESSMAAKEYESALLSSFDDPEVTMRARFELAEINFDLGSYEEAAKMYMMVAILYENDKYCPSALARAGEAFERLERIDKAREAYRQLLKRYEKHAIADTARKRLTKLRTSR